MKLYKVIPNQTGPMLYWFNYDKMYKMPTHEKLETCGWQNKMSSVWLSVSD
jgi:hypothetical protein